MSRSKNIAALAGLSAFTDTLQHIQTLELDKRERKRERELLDKKELQNQHRYNNELISIHGSDNTVLGNDGWRTIKTGDDYNFDITAAGRKSKQDAIEKGLLTWGSDLRVDGDPDKTLHNIGIAQQYHALGLTYDPRGTLFTNEIMVAKDVARGGGKRLGDDDINEAQKFLELNDIFNINTTNIDAGTKERLVSMGLMDSNDSWEDSRNEMAFRWRYLKMGIMNKDSMSGYMSRNDWIDRDLEVSNAKMELVNQLYDTDPRFKKVHDNAENYKKSVMNYFHSMMPHLNAEDEMVAGKMQVTNKKGKTVVIDFSDDDWQMELEKAGHAPLMKLFSLYQSGSVLGVMDEMSKHVVFNDFGDIILETQVFKDIAAGDLGVASNLKKALEYNHKLDKLKNDAYSNLMKDDTWVDPRSVSGFQVALRFMQEHDLFNNFRKAKYSKNGEEILKFNNQMTDLVINSMDSAYQPGSPEDFSFKSDMIQMIENYANLYASLPDTKETMDFISME